MRGRGSPAWITLVSTLGGFPFIFQITKVYACFVQYSNIDLCTVRADPVGFSGNPIVMQTSNNETLSFHLVCTYILTDVSKMSRLTTRLRRTHSHGIDDK